MPKVDDINMEFHLDMYFRYICHIPNCYFDPFYFHEIFLKDNFGMMEDLLSANPANSLLQ